MRQGQRERAVKYGAALTPYQGAHLCVLVCLPHKMASGSGNGPWKWLLSCAHSTLYGLGFFMWQLGCWDTHPRGCTLIKDSSSGLFCTASCGHWPSFHPWACSYTAALLLGLAVTPSNTLGLVTWLKWLLTWPASRDPSLPVGEFAWNDRRLWMGHICPPKMAAISLGFQRQTFPSWQCQNIMSGMAKLMCHLKAAQPQNYSCGKKLVWALQ